jgi:transposase
MKSPEIAQKLGVTPRTIQRWIALGDIPYSRPRKQRPRLLDPYKDYVLSRWHQGCHKGAQLERELKAKGYKGSGRAMYRYLATLEPAASSAAKRGSSSAKRLAENLAPNPLLTLSASQATWLFFRKDEDLKPEEQETLRQLRQASPDLETAYQLVKEFLHMVHELTGERLEEWLGKVETSHLQAFQSFVTGVYQDKDAVLAGLTLPWSNGPVEGHVNRLKLIKRSMYGQAELNLLKLRVLHHSPKSLERKRKKKQAQQKEHLKILKERKKNTNSQHTTEVISKVA